MKLRAWALSVALCTTSLYGATVNDGGGRDVSIALFSTHTLRAVTMTPLGEHSWIARCARCSHESLTTPLHVATVIDIFAGGTLRVTDDVSGEARTGQWVMASEGDQARKRYGD